MGSATNQAIIAGREALAQVKGDAFALGVELFAARDAIAESAQLVTALTGAAVAPAAKTALVERAFAGLSVEARSVLLSVAGSRWSRPEDLLTGLEELGIRAVASSAGDGTAVIEELAAFQKAVTEDPELEYAVGSALVSGAEKSAVVERLLTGKTSPQTVAILAALVARADGRRIGAMLKLAAALVADQAGKVVATVSTAQPLSTAQADAIRATVAGSEQRDVVLTQVIDPTVIGGARVVIGDRVIDGTVASRLNDLRLALAG